MVKVKIEQSRSSFIETPNALEQVLVQPSLMDGSHLALLGWPNQLPLDGLFIKPLNGTSDVLTLGAS